MKVLWFHLMPYPDLPDDFKEKNPSVWVTIDRNLFDAWYALGVGNVLEGYRNQQDQKLLRRGEADLMRALELDSQSPYVHRWLGYARFFQKDYDGAIEIWEAGKELAPNDQAEFERNIQSARNEKKKNP